MSILSRMIGKLEEHDSQCCKKKKKGQLLINKDQALKVVEVDKLVVEDAKR